MKVAKERRGHRFDQVGAGPAAYSGFQRLKSASDRRVGEQRDKTFSKWLNSDAWHLAVGPLVVESVPVGLGYRFRDP